MTETNGNGLDDMLIFDRDQTAEPPHEVSAIIGLDPKLGPPSSGDILVHGDLIPLT